MWWLRGRRLHHPKKSDDVDAAVGSSDGLSSPIYYQSTSPILINVQSGVTLHLGIIKGVRVKGYGDLIWDLNMVKFQTAIPRHHRPQKKKCFCRYFLFGETKRFRHTSNKLYIWTICIFHIHIYIYIYIHIKLFIYLYNFMRRQICQ